MALPLVRSRTYTTLLCAAIALCSWQCGSDKPSQPQSQTPDITQFSAVPLDIVPGDSTLVTYTAVRADSLVLAPPGQKLSSATSGSLYLKPLVPTRYILRAYNSSGRDSASVQITMSSLAPILTLSLSEDTIVTGDSTILTYSTVRADSVILQGIGRLTPASGGIRVFKPTTSVSYTAVAFGVYGNDTASVAVRVEVPYEIQAVNGRYFRSTMGSSIPSPAMKFRIVDFSAQPLRKVWAHFRMVEGDGYVYPDSDRADVDEFVYTAYSFSGSRADAVVRIVVPGVDSVDVLVRARMLVPGAKAQAQYVLLTDNYQTIKGFNGLPNSIDSVPGKYLRVANYEASLGFVAVIDDANHNDVADDNELVNTMVNAFGERTGLIINTVNGDTTIEGIGIGSNYASIRSAFGIPDTSYEYSVNGLDSAQLIYNSLGMTYFCGLNTATNGDTIVAEIHLWKP